MTRRKIMKTVLPPPVLPARVHPTRIQNRVGRLARKRRRRGRGNRRCGCRPSRWKRPPDGRLSISSPRGSIPRWRPGCRSMRGRSSSLLKLLRCRGRKSADSRRKNLTNFYWSLFWFLIWEFWIFFLGFSLHERLRDRSSWEQNSAMEQVSLNLLVKKTSIIKRIKKSQFTQLEYRMSAPMKRFVVKQNFQISRHFFQLPANFLNLVLFFLIKVRGWLWKLKHLIVFCRLKEAVSEIMVRREAEYIKEFTKAAGTTWVFFSLIINFNFNSLVLRCWTNFCSKKNCLGLFRIS